MNIKARTLTLDGSRTRADSAVVATARLFLACGLAAVPCMSAMAGPAPIGLGGATSFAVLAGSTVTNTGDTVINGDLGVWPGTAVTGFPPGLVTNGSIYASDATAMSAEAGLTQAYQEAAGETGAASLTGVNLGGMTLSPGVYSFASSAQLTGLLTLDAANVANSLFIFQINSTLTTASNAMVRMTNFGAGDRVIWEVGSSATLGSDTAFAGDILALTSITLDAGANISCGAALARNGAVTLDDNTISTSGASCGSGGTSVPEPGSAWLFLSALCVVASAYACRALGRTPSGFTPV